MNKYAAKFPLLVLSLIMLSLALTACGGSKKPSDGVYFATRELAPVSSIEFTGDKVKAIGILPESMSRSDAAALVDESDYTLKDGVISFMMGEYAVEFGFRIKDENTIVLQLLSGNKSEIEYVKEQDK